MMLPVKNGSRFPVPALVSEELFSVVQRQLQENRQRARQGQRGAKYLLQGFMGGQD